MLQQLCSQGVGRVVFTPHYYPYNCDIGDFIKKRNDCAAALLAQPDIPQEMEYHIAAEVRIHESLIHLSKEDVHQLCIPSTQHILVEFPYGARITTSILQQVSALMYNFDCIPILAHIERYLAQIKMRDLQELLNDGCKLQINLNGWQSLSFLQRRRLSKLIANGWVDCCGTDCHNLSKRPPLYAEPARHLQKIAGYDTANAIITATSIF